MPGKELKVTFGDQPITPTEKILLDQQMICDKLESIEKNQMRQFLALIGVIMALIGQKFISTPWWIDVSVILALISGSFLAGLLIVWWKIYSKPQKATRIIGATLMLFSSITNIFIFRAGLEKAPEWFPPIINILMILLAIALMWAGWTQLPKNRNKEC